MPHCLFTAPIEHQCHMTMMTLKTMNHSMITMVKLNLLCHVNHWKNLWARRTDLSNLIVLFAQEKLSSTIQSGIDLHVVIISSIIHSLIISRELLILTLSIFKALKVCISWYSLATGLISEAMIYKDHIIQYSPCALGSVQRNTSLGTVFPRTLPRESIGNTSSRGNIDNAPAMM